MGQHAGNRPIGEAVELLKTVGFEGLAGADYLERECLACGKPD